MLASEIFVGYHPDGFRIDKTAAPMDRYTKWSIAENGDWSEAQPVCFHALPENGWVSMEKFNLQKIKE